jgi:hypothetical protein
MYANRKKAVCFQKAVSLESVKANRCSDAKDTRWGLSLTMCKAFLEGGRGWLLQVSDTLYTPILDPPHPHPTGMTGRN